MAKRSKTIDATVAVENTAIRKALAFDTPDSERVFCLTILEGPDVGKQVFIREPKTYLVGRQDYCDIVIAEKSISRVHSVLIRKAGGDVFVMDNDSVNGTHINSKRIAAHQEWQLVSGDRLRLGKDVLMRVDVHDEKAAKLQVDLYEAAVRDGMTKLYNRKYVIDVLEREFALAQRKASHFCLLMFDVDHFKLVNDTYGHDAGDEALRMIARSIGGTLRKEDVFARYGGEEFLIVMKNLDLTQAEKLAERLRKIVDSNPVNCAPHSFNISISLGLVGSSTAKYRSVNDMLKHVDRLLYKAKRNGRNRLELPIRRAA